MAEKLRDMFLRFSKGAYKNADVYSKCVLLNGSAIMEYNHQIVGIAKLHETTEKYHDYDIVVASGAIISAEKIANNLKNFIGKSFKFEDTADHRRRKYFVEVIEGAELPVKADIVFSRK